MDPCALCGDPTDDQVRDLCDQCKLLIGGWLAFGLVPKEVFWQPQEVTDAHRERVRGILRDRKGAR